MKSFTVEEISTILNGNLVGTTDQKINGLEHLEKAQNNQITFIGSVKYSRLWPESNATVAIVNENLKVEPGEGRVFIKVKNADLAMARLLEEFKPCLLYTSDAADE